MFPHSRRAINVESVASRTAAREFRQSPGWPPPDIRRGSRTARPTVSRFNRSTEPTPRRRAEQGQGDEPSQSAAPARLPPPWGRRGVDAPFACSRDSAFHTKEFAPEEPRSAQCAFDSIESIEPHIHDVRPRVLPAMALRGTSLSAHARSQLLRRGLDEHLVLHVAHHPTELFRVGPGREIRQASVLDRATGKVYLVRVVVDVLGGRT